MKFWNLTLLFFISLFSVRNANPTIPCPNGWDCKKPSQEIWQALSTKLSVSIYFYNNIPKIVVMCDVDRGQNDLPPNILTKFTFPVQVTQFFFANCHLPQNTTYAEILGNKTVENFRIIPGEPLMDSLTAKLFKGFGNLAYLSINNCGLTSVPNNLLEYTPNIITLKLQENKLTTLPSEMFKYSPNLVNLDLSNNELVSLTNYFPGLLNLQMLLLYHNQIERISTEFMDSVPQLQTLDLQYNKISQLSDDLLRKVQLTSFKIFRNHLESLPENLLASQTQLSIFSCSDNSALSELPPKLLRNTPALASLAIEMCNVSEIPANFLNYSTLLNVTELKFSRNNLQFLHPKTFSRLTNLTSIDLSFNKLSAIGSDTFTGLKKLESISLKSNKISFIDPDAFTYQDQLKKMDLSNNNLQTIDNSLFEGLSNLETLDLSRNKLTYTDSPYRPFKLPSSLTNINLSYNHFNWLPSNWILELIFLQTLNMQHNELSEFHAQDCQPSSDVMRLDISYNNISRAIFEMGIMEQLMSTDEPSQEVTSQSRVILEHNPFNCDCHADGLLQYYHNQVDQRYGFLLQIDALRCAEPEKYRGEYVRYLQMPSLVCEIQESCPDKCRCRNYALGNVMEVDCSGLNLTSFPTVAPAGTSVLHIENNELSEFANISFPAWQGLTSLYIANNKISTIADVQLPQGIEELDLRGNKLSVMDSSVLQSLNASSSLSLILLQNNPWDCSNCENTELREFLQSNTERVGNVSMIFCDGTRNELYLDPICDSQPTVTKTVLISAVLVCFLMATGLAAMAVSYYKYNHEIKVWLYAHKMCLWFVKEKELDKNKRFDAFISFSQEDAEFVSSQLMPGLEENAPFYKLCIHHRDWLAGEWIPDQIIRSVQDSRRTIVVLSKNFIKSVWGRLEFKAAHHQALQDKTNRIIILVFGDLPPASEMDPDLKMYVKFNTYLQWGDDWFWQKLRYAMPHCPIRSSSVPPQSFKNLSDPRRSRKPGDPNKVAVRLANLNKNAKT